MANFWILSGSEENWAVAFKEDKWGTKKKFEDRWNQLSPGDILVFYVTSPICGIVGFGKLTKKKEEKTPYWPEEIRKKKVVWPFRFYFELIYKLPYLDWREKRLNVQDLKLSSRAVIKSLKDDDIALLLERIKASWGIDLSNFTKVKIKEMETYFYGDLVQNKELEEVAKERKKTYHEMSIVKEMESYYLKKEWKPKSKSKNKVRLVKDKKRDELLEDKVWLLFKNMGFTEMNKDRNFKIQAGPIIKQVDVFARDEHNIFIVECKASRTKDSSRDLSPVIHEILDLKPNVIESIRKHYGKDFRFSFLLVTQNIKWRSNARKLAVNSRKKDFFCWNGKELNGYINLTNQLKEAAKFQMFSILFPKRKFSKLRSIKIPAILAGKGRCKYYSFVIQPEKLLRVAYVHRREESSPEETSFAYQRMVKKSRLDEIRKFIVEKGGFFPNNIILNFTKAPKFERKAEVGDVVYGILKFPRYYKSAWVIDGQHRLYGYLDTKQKETASLPVVAFENLDIKRQANLFVEINKYQQPVSANLLWDLYPDIYSGSDDPKQQHLSVISLIVKKLNSESSSPLYRNVEIPSSPIKDKEVANVTLNNICVGIKENRLVNEGGLLFKTDYERTIDFAYKRLRTYFNIIAKSFPQDWKKGDKGLLRTNVGIRIFLIIFRQLLKYLDYKGMKNIYRREDLSEFENKAKK